ncbi:MAG: SDR family oxidoreductase [Alphaproteobacteria bacterium]|nr:SDR family oxidoreductase [Alphaproteobacteria bacterium]
MNDLFSVSGKIALVTGGSRGIGLMIARGYVANGVKTYISSRKAEICDKVAAELSKEGTCISLPADVSEMEGVVALANALKSREERLDILVNNAGATWGAPFAEFPESGWDKVMDLNVKSIFFLTKELLPLLRRSGTPEDPARVINIGSIAGLRIGGAGGDNVYSYPASKAAVHHLTHALAGRLSRENITVNAIAPGPFESKMMAEALRTRGDAIAASNPRGRIGSPEDMAGTAIYLASRAGAYTNGVVLPLDGGITACS